MQRVCEVERDGEEKASSVVLVDSKSLESSKSLKDGVCCQLNLQELQEARRIDDDSRLSTLKSAMLRTVEEHWLAEWKQLMRLLINSAKLKSSPEQSKPTLTLSTRCQGKGRMAKFRVIGSVLTAYFIDGESSYWQISRKTPDRPKSIMTMLLRLRNLLCCEIVPFNLKFLFLHLNFTKIFRELWICRSTKCGSPPNISTPACSRVPKWK